MAILWATFSLPKRLASVLLTSFSMGQFCTVFFLAFRQRLGLMTSSEVPFQPELFSDVVIDATYAYLLLSVFNFTFALFSQGIAYYSWGFFGLNSVQDSKAHAVLSIWYSDFKACHKRVLLTIDFSFFAVVLVKWFVALANQWHGIHQLIHVKWLGCVPCVQVFACTCPVSCVNAQEVQHRGYLT